MIHIESDWSEIEKELDRIEGLPDAKARLALDVVLQEVYVDTQGKVHIQTGSLKDSGKVDSDVDKFDHSWEGDITYGGPSSGPNNPVDYAIYEKRREPDELGDHNFMRDVLLHHPSWVAAVRAGLKG